MPYKKFGREKSKVRRKMKNATKKTSKKNKWTKENKTGLGEEHKVWFKNKQKTL